MASLRRRQKLGQHRRHTRGMAGAPIEEAIEAYSDLLEKAASYRLGPLAM
jgi:hypothetical protein